MRITRTEGNRIYNAATLDSAKGAKEKTGADLVKVWDSTVDKSTRPDHVMLDGQVRELEEDFEVNGRKASAPGHFGIAAEDINCRCCALIEPRSDINQPFTKMNNETGELLEFENVKSYEEFKKKYWGTVDKSGGSGIIEEREELPRKMKSGSYAVDWAKVQSDEYSQKFVKLSKDECISSAIETRAKWALSNRDGKNTEELYALSMLDGHEISRITNQNYNSAVKRTAAFTKKLNIADEAEERILLIHNHPKGLPPSISDINALLKNKNIEGITVGHNGSVYLYTKPKTAIPSDEWIVAMKHFKDFSEETAMEKSLEILSRKFGFNIQKL